VSILDRYVWKELVAPFLLGLFVFTFLLLVDKIFDLTDLIINKGVPVPLVLLLLAYILPAFLVLTIPIGFLLAILVAFGRLSADMEVVALKACGVSPLRLLRPVLLFGALTTVATGYLIFEAVPRANHAFKSLIFDIVRTQASVGLKERVFNDTFGNFVIYVDEIAADQVALRHVFVSDERKPEESRLITAREGRLISDEATRRLTLRLLDGAVHETSPQALQKYRQVSFRLYDITLVLENPLIRQGEAPKGDREMSVAELRTMAATLTTSRGNPNPYLVELHKKFAIPAACLVFSVLGVPLGIRAHRGGRWGAFVALLPVVLFYYVALTLGESLGDAGRLPPWLAMWGPNLIVGALALYLLRANLRERPIPLVAAASRLGWAVWDRLAGRRRRPATRVHPVPARHDRGGPRRTGAARAWVAEGRGGVASRTVGYALAVLLVALIVRDRLALDPLAWVLGVLGCLAMPPVVRRLRRGVMDRYLSGEFLTLFGYGLALAAVVVIVGDLMTTLERYVRFKPGLALILLHYVYRIPPFLYQGLHIVVLMSVILLFLGLSRSHELTALKAGGVSLYRVSLPVFALAVMVTLGSLAFQELLMPTLNQRGGEVDAKIRRRTLPELRKRTQIWYRGRDSQTGESRIYHIDLLDPVNREMSGVSVLELGPIFDLRRRWDARQMRWTEADESWRLVGGVRRDFAPGQADRVEMFREERLRLPERFSDFAEVPRAPDVMSYTELREYIRRLEAGGHKVAKYLVDLYSKLAFPFAHPIMALVGIPFALQSPRGGRVIGIALCLVLGLGYFIVHSAALALARTELLTPVVAAWAANALFASLGLFFFLRART
jgi:lipopolysaccharide export system permease protein